jgi:hypothetical protein
VDAVEPLGKDVVHVRDAIDVATDRLMEVDPLEPMVAGLTDSEPSGVTSQKLPRKYLIRKSITNNALLINKCKDWSSVDGTL